jgi:hypothetical protein
MNQPLRPMSLGEILDRTFQIYRSRFWVFAGIAALPALAMMAIHLANEFWWKIRPTDDASLFGVFNIDILWIALLFFHFHALLHFLVMPCMTQVASDEVLGKACGLSAALRSFFNHWLANAGLTLFVLSCVLLLPEIVIVLLEGCTAMLAQSVGIDTTGQGLIWAPMMTVGILTGIVAYFWFSSRYAMSWCACRLEGLSAWRSLGRSRRLSRSTRLRLFVAQIVPTALWWVLSFAVTIAIGLLIRSLRAEGVRYIIVLRAYLLLTLAGTGAVSAILGPIYPIAITLFYYDQRIRKEGYDIERMMQAAGWAEAAILPVAADPAAMARWKELL